jgi:hypothetical protein
MKRIPQCPECKSTEVLYRQTVNEYWTIESANFELGDLSLGAIIDNVVTGEYDYTCSLCAAKFKNLDEFNIFEEEKEDEKTLFERQMQMVKSLVERYT